ncbi:hypothetical protein Tco_1393797 [Tanacetum coccineum]
MKRLAEDNRVPLKEARKYLKQRKMHRQSLVIRDLKKFLNTHKSTLEKLDNFFGKKNEVIKEEKRVGEEDEEDDEDEDDDGDAAGGEEQSQTKR